MAMLSGSTNSLPKSYIEAAQSVVAAKATDPRLSRRLCFTDSIDSSIFQRRFHVILYYNKLSSKDSGWFLAGWGKETLGRALQEHPILAGRLRRVEEGGQGELEVVSNDSGIRLFEARISKTLLEFLDLKGREKDAEAELVFWNDVDEQNPQFSPLFYIQVTNFQCGGYSIGISCSLLLADPLTMLSFLRRWSNIHNNVVNEADASKLPLFYLPNLKPNGSSPTNPIGSNRIKDAGKPMIFKTTTKKMNPVDESHEMHKELALQCIEEAERELGAKTASKFSLFVKELSEETKLEKYSREELTQQPLNFRSGLTRTSWDDLGASEVHFYKGNNPAHVSYWINCVSGEGLVILIPSPPYENVPEMNIIVTIPSKTEIM